MAREKRDPDGFPADPTARAQEERLERMLGELPGAPAPSSLRAEVMAELRATPLGPWTRFRRWWSGLGAWRVPIQLAPAAALVLVAVIGHRMLQSPDVMSVASDTSVTIQGRQTDLDRDLVAEGIAAGQPVEIAAGDDPTLGTVSVDDVGRARAEMFDARSVAELQEPAEEAFPIPTRAGVAITLAKLSSFNGGSGVPGDSSALGRADEPISIAAADSALESASTLAFGEPARAAFADAESPATVVALEETLAEPEPIEIALPVPEPMPRVSGGLSIQAERIDEEASRTRRSSGRELDQLSSRGAPTATGPSLPPSALGLRSDDGTVATADRFREMRDRAHLPEPSAPQVGTDTDRTRLEAEADDPDSVLDAVEQIVDDYNGWVNSRQAVTSDRGILRAVVEIPRWRIEVLRRELALLSDPRLADALAQVVEEEIDERHLPPSQRRVVEVEILVYRRGETPVE